MESARKVESNLIHRVNVGDTLTRTAARYPQSLAVVDGPRRLTYRRFNEWVNQVAHSLSARGFGRGDALAIASGNSAEFLVTYYACAKNGIVCVPINLGWRADEVTHVLDDSKARGIVVERDLLDAVVPALPGRIAQIFVVGEGSGEHTAFVDLTGPVAEPEHFVDDRDPITYLYTSGTTSLPKGVVGNHTAIYLESMTMALECRFDSDDRFVAMLPMFHTAQLNCHCTAAIMVGAVIHVRRGFGARDLLDLIESERITQIFGLPMMYRELLEDPTVRQRDLSSLRRACYAMAPMPQEQLARCLEVFGCDFYLLFGQTEMSPTATIFRPEHQLSHPGAAGTAAINVQVGIMDSDGRLLDPGQEGEIVYRGPHALTEYLNDPEATGRAFRSGWFHSGDVGRLDVDGMLWFTDRYKDVIKTGGENVASIDVERALYRADPGIAEAAVVGLPHERWSEAITAFVVARDAVELDPEAVLAAVKNDLDPYKVPKAVIVVEGLPKTSTGKIQKNVVREQWHAHYSAPAAGSRTDPDPYRGGST